MSRISKILLTLALAAAPALAQTITPNESTIVVPSPKKVGMNIDGVTNYLAGQIRKNFLYRNPGFEPEINRQKWVAYPAGTTTTFPTYGPYDPVPANFWAGATFNVYRGIAPRVNVCSGTIASNTVAGGGAGAGTTFTFSTACSTAIAEADVIVVRKPSGCIPEALWEAQGAGWWTSTYGGGKITSDCSTPYDGAESLVIDASVASSNAALLGYMDSNALTTGVLFNGTYNFSGFYKVASGSPSVNFYVQRLVASTPGNPINCTSTPTWTATTWTAFSITCTATELATVTPGTVRLELFVSGGAVEVDDLAFQKTSGLDPTNTTVFRDEFVNAMKAHCAGGVLSMVPCELRGWYGQNADEIANTVKPIFQRSIANAAGNYDAVGASPGDGSIVVNLQEFLELCALVGAEPYYVLPETTTPEEASNWIDYIAGSTGTTYGAIRSANGHPASWLTVFPTIHLSMGNENWNEGNSGQGLGYRNDAPDLYYDYSTDAAGVWAAMRASSSWPFNGAGFDLALGMQTANAGTGVQAAMQRSGANSGELAPYTQDSYGDVSTLALAWNPLFFEVGQNTTNTGLVFQQQAVSILPYGKLNVYEMDNGTNTVASGVTQANLDAFTTAAGYGTATALQSLQQLAFGVVNQNFFAASEYNTSVAGFYIHQWGGWLDFGGATNGIRPQELGLRMANAAIIGPMYSCGLASPTTYNQAANHNGGSTSGVPATSNVPQQFAFCFKSGTKRSMIVINTDIAASHAITFAGSQAPTGTVTVTRYDPSSISLTNEATANNPYNAATQNVSIDAPFTVSSPASDTVPPYSINRYDWTVAGGLSVHGEVTQGVFANQPGLGSIQGHGNQGIYLPNGTLGSINGIPNQ